MKDKLILTAFLAIVMTVTPIFYLKVQPQEEQKKPPITEDTKNIVFTVYDDDADVVLTLDGRQYMIGVLAAEMPASYDEEALKAQAVAAMTYAYRRKLSGNIDEAHTGAELCTDSNHCKGYLHDNEMKEKWGITYSKYLKKITQAVDSVYGEIMTYENAPIDAVFHSVSSGKTESAQDVWGADIPYLKSVDSHFDEEYDKYLSEVKLSKKELKELMSDFNEEADFSEDEEDWLCNVKRSSAGGIITAELCGITLSGRSIRKLFKLRSTNFQLSFDDGTFTFRVKGYGHGVGMSQYGANALAKEGMDYREILMHYYQGIEFENIIN